MQESECFKGNMLTQLLLIRGYNRVLNNNIHYVLNSIRIYFLLLKYT
jgi:hypothetical protein